MPIYAKSAILIFKKWEKTLSLCVATSVIPIENTMQDLVQDQLVQLDMESLQ